MHRHYAINSIVYENHIEISKLLFYNISYIFISLYKYTTIYYINNITNSQIIVTKVKFTL